MSREDYVKLGADDQSEWMCPGCWLAELPFADASVSSLSSDDSSILGSGDEVSVELNEDELEQGRATSVLF